MCSSDLIDYFDVREGTLTCGTDEMLPITLTPGSSIDFHVQFVILPIPPGKDYISSEIIIYTSLGELKETVFYNEVLSINEISAETKVYPNPMSNILHIEGVDVQDVTIFNAVGQMVLFVEKMNEINVEDLSEGLYFVRISDKRSNSVVKKIVKR